jgi:hypothetical protein
MSVEATKFGWIRSYLPIVGMIRSYDRRWLRADLIAIAVGRPVCKHADR